MGIFVLRENMLKRGRPKMKTGTVKQPFSIRITPEEKKLLANRAKANGQKLTAWARNQLIAAAGRDNP
jgi:uncharacterized protein (DUF1778 family)